LFNNQVALQALIASLALAHHLTTEVAAQVPQVATVSAMSGAKFPIPSGTYSSQLSQYLYIVRELFHISVCNNLAYVISLSA
jgi:hypothetical protein